MTEKNNRLKEILVADIILMFLALIIKGYLLGIIKKNMLILSMVKTLSVTEEKKEKLLEISNEMINRLIIMDKVLSIIFNTRNNSNVCSFL